MEARKTRSSQQLESAMRTLLDHIAVELAHEYIRLMEAAAEKESEPRDHQGGQQ